MNKLPLEKRTQILAMLCEGNSLRATSRVVGCSFNTTVKLLMLDKLAKNITILMLEILNQDVFNVMRYGVLFMPKKKIFPKTYKVNLGLVVFGLGLQWIAKVNLFFLTW